MRMLGATVTRPGPSYSIPNGGGDVDTMRVRDEQVRVQCIAGVVTFKLEDGTLLEFDEAQINGALFFAAHNDAA